MFLLQKHKKWDSGIRSIWQRQYIKHMTGASLLCRRISSFECPNAVFDIRAGSEYQVLNVEMLFLTFELSPNIKF